MEKHIGKGWKIAALACAALLVAGAAVFTLWAVRGGGEGGGESGIGLEVASQESEKTQPPDGNAEDGKPREEGGKAGGGELSGDEGQKTDAPGTGQNIGTQVLPIPASSVDEALLAQAAMDYVKSFAGATDDFSIVDIKFSVIDPRWARVVIAQKHGGLDMSYPVYFYYQGDSWVPEPTGPGTPAIPTDI